MSRIAFALCVTALAAGAAPLAGQSKQPKRPKAATADTNNALAYYRFALGQLEDDPAQASDALYWSLRLEPSWAEALYARRVSLLRADEHRLIKYIQGDKKTRRQFRAVDSLLSRARMIDPFLYQDLDKGLLTHYFRAAIEADVRSTNPSVNPGDLRYAIEQYTRELMSPGGDHSLAGWLAFSERRLPEALARYAKAIGKKHDKPDLHDTRATIFYLMQQYDSAAAELGHALAELKQEEDKDLQLLYQPKAMLHHRLGYVLLRKNDFEGAHQAFAHALEEDLAFYPAHIILASMALAAKDTATAVQEMQLAVELNPSEPLPYMRQADLLLATGQPEAAAAALLKVVAMEPLYAAPHFQLARAAEAMAKPTEAVEHYQHYIVRAPRDDRNVASARQRIQALAAQPGTTP